MILWRFKEMGTELEFTNCFEFEVEIHNSRTSLYNWLDEELNLQPEQLKEQILEGCDHLSMNYNKRGI